MALPTGPDDLRTHLERALKPNYELHDEIGRGGMGIVYRARDTRLRRTVAIKLLPPELGFRADIRSRFLREAQTSAQLEHPNIVPIYTVEEAGSLVFFTMGYVAGGNLAHRLQERGRMQPDEARRILREVAVALAYAHSRDVVHRDIKPDNILLGEQGRALVTDFGIARAVTDAADMRLTTTGVVVGTPAYMSPEQSAGERTLDGRSDLYALGVVGYQMLCGELPFIAANTPSMLVKHLSETPRPLGDRCTGIPAELSAAVMRCIEKNPENRFRDADELVAALDGNAQSVSAWGTAANLAHSPTATASAVSPAPMTMPSGGRVAHRDEDHHSAEPTFEEMARWEAGPVARFRRKLVPWVVGNAVLIPFAMFTDRGLLFFSGVWTFVLALKYGKLVADNYDWRDVFRQPRDRLLVDVMGETVDELRAISDPTSRALVQQRERLRGERPGLFRAARRSPLALPASAARASAPAAVTGMLPVATPTLAGQLPVVQQALADRDEIHRVVDALPKHDREMLPDVNASADALCSRIELLAVTADELERANVPGLGDAVEREIAELEAAANPLDEEASERRIRRLMQLRRQRIALRDTIARRAEALRQLGRCCSALSTMRLDLLRLSAGGRAAGGPSYQSVTLLAGQAMQMGREVDAVVYAHDELARIK